MKPMKPCKAWAIADNCGRLIETNAGVPILRATHNNPCDWVEDDERFVRVRILEDAAVERAIAVLRSLDADFWVGNPTGDKIEAAIRDLGGKP